MIILMRIEVYPLLVFYISRRFCQNAKDVFDIDIIYFIIPFIIIF